MYTQYLERYGYPAVFVNILLESFGFPLPGEITLIAAAVLAGKGELSIRLVLVLAAVAAVAGDNIGYIIGRLGGRRAVLRFGRYVFPPERRLEKIERLFGRYGPAIVLVARFVSGLRQLNGIIAGILGMPWRKFLLFNAGGAVIWVAAWGGLAYAVGHHTHNVYAFFRRFEFVLLCILAGAALVYAVYRAARRAGRK